MSFDLTTNHEFPLNRKDFFSKSCLYQVDYVGEEKKVILGKGLRK